MKKQNGTIHDTDCGNCKHFHRMSAEEYLKRNFVPMRNLYMGFCDKIPKGTVYDGKYTYDGYSFCDENYDECLHCFEEITNDSI